MPIVTIISPVYNVENFLEKGIESVLKQSLTDFEYFVVDDGSTDKSGVICDKYASVDSRVHVIHQRNQGSSAARNAGLEKASGKYVYFIDADDWIEPNMLESMVSLAEKNKADLIVTGFKMEYYLDGKDVTYQTKCPDRVYSSIDEFRLDAYHYLNNSLLSLPWNKLFLRSRIEEQKMRFKKTMWPDHHFCMDYLMDARNVVLSSNAAYHWYRSRKGSATMMVYSNAYMFEKRLEHYEHIRKLYDHWGVTDEDSMNAICSYFVGRVVQCIQETTVNEKLSGKEKRRKVKEIITHPVVREALKKARGMSGTMTIMSFPLLVKSVPLCFLFGRGVGFVRSSFPRLFIKMKEKEVHGA